MKNILVIIIAFIFVLAACSCGAVPDETDTTESNNTETGFKPYKYGIVAGDYIFARNSYHKPVKYNVHDGKMSYLCPDPFCSHNDESCQFYHVDSDRFSPIGNTVYYVKRDIVTGKGTLYSFDVDTSETKTVYSTDGLLTKVYAYEYRLLIHYLSSGDFGAEGYWFWYDTKTGGTERLNEEYISEDYVLFYLEDDRLIWRSLDSSEYYSTDLKGNDFKKHDFRYRYGNLYEIEEKTLDDGRFVYLVYVTLNGETERKLIIDDAGEIYYYENKIVYLKDIPYAERRVVHDSGGGFALKDWSGGNVYVINPDGTDDHLLFHTDEFISGGTDDHAHQLISGDYFGMWVTMFDGDEQLEDRIFIANINTGEFVISHE